MDGLRLNSFAPLFKFTMGRPGCVAGRLGLTIATICAAAAMPSDQRGRVRFSPSHPIGVTLGNSGTSIGNRGPAPASARPNGDPNQNNRPDGPGPCGSPSTCETWVTTNPLAGLAPLPKVHYSFAFDPHYLDVAHANKSSAERALLVDMARIMGSISFSVANNSDSANRTLALVEIAAAAGKAHGSRTPVLSLQYSPWYSAAWKGGHDECSTDGEAAEMEYYRGELTWALKMLQEANSAAGTDIKFGVVLIDSEQFAWSPPAGSSPGWPLPTSCTKANSCLNCCTRKSVSRVALSPSAPSTITTPLVSLKSTAFLRITVQE